VGETFSFLPCRINVKIYSKGDRMRSKSWKIILGLLLLLSLTTSFYSQLELPASSGPYTVGQIMLTWVDTPRPEVLTESPNDFREVAAVIWYPAEPGTGVKAGYFPHLSSVSDALLQSGELEPWEVFGLRFIRSESRLDANPVKTEQPFPVVILSPGNGTNIEFYASLAGEIASHGYIVLGLNHPYDVPAVQLSNGEVAPYNRNQWLLDAEAHQAYSAQRIKVRTADVVFALGQLQEMNSNGLLAGLMDLDAVAAAGHSVGGITASEACKSDTRFKACLNFDGLQRGGPFSMEETAIPPEQPFLFLTKESQLPPPWIERFESMSESYWVVIHGAAHQSFTDGPLLQPSLLPGPNQADRWMGLIQRYSLAFLDQTLKGHSNELLAQAAEEENFSVRIFPSN
jgi:dienelactone hydrolase